MSTRAESLIIQCQAITDRGLNEKRPINEDAFLSDSQRRIFAVADGVGGAQAGEVASQTATEVLDEAFRHQLDGADIEDLMELAIQRANASIHQMAQDHHSFSMMATTIVALHLKENTATIGHVGDSRLYRLTPSGELIRETEDHSVVEEEVRAGRMTADQAANHPSKNVISRALGAEESVEVDLKTLQVEDGTEFLLCTDGITRHISDQEIRQLLVTQPDLKEVCAELKRRCYERGAEDNLTAVIVRCGEPIAAEGRFEDLDRTLSQDVDTLETPIATDSDSGSSPSSSAFVPASRVFFSGEPSTAKLERAKEASPSFDSSSRKSSSVPRVALVIIVLAALVAAFYAGRRYAGRAPLNGATSQSVQPPSPKAAPAKDPSMVFDETRRAIDTAPDEWLANELPKQLAAQGVLGPLESSDPTFLYLYGRASLLTGNNDQAASAFDAAITATNLNPAPANEVIKKDASLALAAVALKSGRNRARALTLYNEILKKPVDNGSR